MIDLFGEEFKLKINKTKKKQATGCGNSLTIIIICNIKYYW